MSPRMKSIDHNALSLIHPATMLGRSSPWHRVSGRERRMQPSTSSKLAKPGLISAIHLVGNSLKKKTKTLY